MKRVLEVNIDDLNSGGVFALVKNIVENKKDDCRIDIASIEGFRNRDNLDFFLKKGSEVYYVGNTNNKILKQFQVYKKLKKIIEKHEYENIHIHGDTSNKLLVSGLAAKKGGVKNIILHSHASDVDGNHRILKKICHVVCKPFLKILDAKFVACSDLAARWMYGTSPYIMINNGVDLNKFRYNEQQRLISRQELEIGDEILIGNVGRFAYQKNHDFILKIAEAMNQLPIQYKIILIGSGELEEKIRCKAERLKLKNVLFLGNSDSVEKLFQAMDVFILPSHFEGLPIVGIEAQTSGLPVIFSNKITKEAAITNSCSYLSIEENSVQLWVEKIIEYSHLRRTDTYEVIKKNGFDILDTVGKICDLYN